MLRVPVDHVFKQESLTLNPTRKWIPTMQALKYAPPSLRSLVQANSQRGWILNRGTLRHLIFNFRFYI